MKPWIWVTGVRAPVGRDIVMALRRSGHQILMIDSFSSCAAKALCNLGHIQFQRIPSPVTDYERFKKALAMLMISHPASKIIPVCEEVMWLAKAAREIGFAERLMAPDFSLLQSLHSKYQSSKLLEKNALTTPHTVKITDRHQAYGLEDHDLVFKPEFSRFGRQVYLGTKAFLKANPKLSQHRPYVAQQRIYGQEVALWSYIIEGKLAAIVAYRPLLRQIRGAAFGFITIDAAPYQALIDSYLNHSLANWSGHFSLDLITDSQGTIYVIECNPRAVSGFHFVRDHPQIGAVLSGEFTPSMPIMPAIGLTGVLKAALYAASILNPALRHTDTNGFEHFEDFFIPKGVPSPLTAHIAGLMDVILFAIRGLSQGRSAIEATTADIEYNHSIENS